MHVKKFILKICLFLICPAYSWQSIQYIAIENGFVDSGIDAKMFTAHFTAWYLINVTELKVSL
jgi:hypothetical protein